MHKKVCKDKNQKHLEVFHSVAEGLKRVYRDKLLPLEEYYLFHDFHSPRLNDADFEAKPMILLVGQYSTGKTTFIRYLLEKDFPGMRIGVEPTTDRFIIVMKGEHDGVIPGNALVVDPTKQFGPLRKYGNSFLNKFQCSLVNSDVLNSITIIDTPGILSGEKQRVDRGYDFTGVLEWFAERVDRIILLFDAHKMDISDEFRRSIEALRGHDDKIKIVLNKADMVSQKELMRVYGALMWSLGKVMNTPEVARVYIGSFCDQPLNNITGKSLFEAEERDMFVDIQSLPRNAALRKMNDLVKRARLAKVHAFIISTLRKEMPSVFGKESKKKELIKKLNDIFEEIQKARSIPLGDFPDSKLLGEKLIAHDFLKFPALKMRLIKSVDSMLQDDICRIMAKIPLELAMSAEEMVYVKGETVGGLSDTPFGVGRGVGTDAGSFEIEWIVNRYREKYDEIFRSLNPTNGKISGAEAKTEMLKSKLPNSVLGKIWKLSDIDHDGFLDADEFALAMYLIQVKLDGHEIPQKLPKHLEPPIKRRPEPRYLGYL